MSENPPEPTAEIAPEREGDDDHDLLTYGEAGVRLFEEVAAQRATVAELSNSSTDPMLLAKAQARLQSLEDAAARNTRQVINDDNFERFFGYKGSARRNT
jgi:hypothetical protein